MSKSTDLTIEASAGYASDMTGVANPFLATSPSWYAYRLGEYLKRTGRTLPRDVRMGRGYQIHANDMLFSFDNRNAITRVK
jgi:hypothetical protein